MSKSKQPPFDYCRYYRGMIADLEMQIARDKKFRERGWQANFIERDKAQEERLEQCRVALAKAQIEQGQMPL